MIVATGEVKQISHDGHSLSSLYTALVPYRVEHENDTDLKELLYRAANAEAANR